MSSVTPSSRTPIPSQRGSAKLRSSSRASSAHHSDDSRHDTQTQLETTQQCRLEPVQHEPRHESTPLSPTPSTDRPQTTAGRRWRPKLPPPPPLSASLDSRRLRTMAKRGPTGLEPLRTTQIMKRDLLYGRATIVTEDQLRWLQEDTKDEDYDTDLDKQEEKEELSREVRIKTDYEKKCRRLGVAPSSYLERNLRNAQLSMRHHSLGPKRSKALTHPLQVNQTIEKLDLEDNDIQNKGARYFAALIDENDSISELNLAGNSLEADGALKICSALAHNCSLQTVDLSRNKITDRAAIEIANVLAKNKYILELNLSHNQLGDRAGLCIGKALEKNETLEVLDLSWNQIQICGAEDFSKGFRKNRNLVRLSLAYNGVGAAGARAISSAVAVHKSLQELDLTANHINSDRLTETANNFARSKNLRVLRLGRNNFDSENAVSILTAIKSQPSSRIIILDLQDVVVRQEFADLAKDVMLARKGRFEVIFEDLRQSKGAIDSYSKYTGRSELQLVLSFLSEKNITLNTLLSSSMKEEIDNSGEIFVTKEEFVQAIQGVECPLTEPEIGRLSRQLDTAGDGRLRITDLVQRGL